MRIGTLVAGVLVMAAGFGVGALAVGWPALVVGAPLVFGGLVVALVTYLDGVQKQHARQYRYAQVARQQQAAAMPAWDGYGEADHGRRAWTEYRPRQDEDTLDSEDLAELIARIPSGVDVEDTDHDAAGGDASGRSSGNPD
jgi:hypothetical protein